MKLLFRSGAGISYNDVTKQIKSFLAEVQNNVNLALKNISKGQPAHITIDSSDGRQQTLTGLNTTYHITHKCNNLYPKKNQETSKLTQEMIDDDQEESISDNKKKHKPPPV